MKDKIYKKFYLIACICYTTSVLGQNTQEFVFNTCKTSSHNNCEKQMFKVLNNGQHFQNTVFLNDKEIDRKNISSFLFHKENIPGKRMKRTGVLFTALGAVFIAGSVMIFNYDAHNTYPTSAYPSIIEERTGVIFGGLVTGACGVVMTGGGIALWTIGNKKMKMSKNNTMN